MNHNPEGYCTPCKGECLEVNSRNHRITVVLFQRGYAAVHIADYKDMNWNFDIVDVGTEYYKTRILAEQEAQEWAKAERLKYVPPSD